MKTSLKKTKIRDREIFLHFKIIDNFSSRLTWCSLLYIDSEACSAPVVKKATRIFDFFFLFFFFTISEGYKRRS